MPPGRAGSGNHVEPIPPSSHPLAPAWGLLRLSGTRRGEKASSLPQVLHKRARAPRPSTGELVR
eukprot:6739415-Pyramimonas_sp.AAC.1